MFLLTLMRFLFVLCLNLSPLFLHLTETEYVCVPCGPQGFVSQIERSLRRESGMEITSKDGNSMLQQHRRFL